MKTRHQQIASLVSLALLHMSAAWAQESTAKREKEDNSLNFDTVVITGSPIAISKMKQSVAITTRNPEQIAPFSPTNFAEILRAIPGVRAESSGGEGNANLTVRGVPISAGGARYVQFQEDGLPILQFGDIAFATPDMFLRVDGSLSHLEIVRGGTASTLASNSPGGIINVISKNGQEAGGNIGITKGLDFNQTRYDFDIGTKVGDKTRMFVGGFYRIGDGARPAGMRAEDGGQIKANITRQLDNGTIRFSFKHLNDKSPMNMPVPVKTRNGTIEALRGIDPRTASFYSPYWHTDRALDKNNNLISTNINEGLRVVNSAFGAEVSLNLGEGWMIDEKFRKSTNSGRFIAIFPADNANTSGAMRYATGPNTGKSYTDAAFTAAVFNTSLDDLGSVINDVKMSKIFALGNGHLTTTLGLYSSVQQLGLTWNFNHYLLQASGERPALINSNATRLDSPGLIAQGTDVWGACCNRQIDAEYKTNAPYLHLGWENAAWNLDGGLRYDKQNASGNFNQAVNQRYTPANSKLIHYGIDHLSYSLGANYRVSKDLAVFGRSSDGVAFNADRIMFANPLDGSTPISTNIVKQHEVGIKWKADNLSSFITLFQAKTSESNYEATTRRFSANSYHATGLELESSYRMDAFRMSAGLTYTNASIRGSNDASVIGNTPRRQAKFIYQIAPTYTLGNAVLGLGVIGTSKSFGDDANTLTMPGFTMWNVFSSYQINTHLQASISVNNLTNTIGYTEVESDGHAARSINGRTIRATLKYAF